MDGQLREVSGDQESELTRNTGLSHPVSDRPADEFRSILESLQPPLQPTVSLSILTPVYNERHLVAASVARVLALRAEMISRLELIVVDDCSSDGSWEVLQRLARLDARIQLYRHEQNSGKGAAIRTALSHATGDICIVHDADMEYNPADIPALLRPFAEEGADAVFGSRYMSAPYRRTLMHRHTVINKGLTSISPPVPTASRK